MQLHELKPVHKSRKAQRIGRGGKRGTYSGKGIKGQTSRAGKNYQPIIREFIKRYPKLRGHKQKRNFNFQKSKIAILNLDNLESKFNAGEKINKFVSSISSPKLNKFVSLASSLDGKASGDFAIKINPEILLEKKIIRRIKGRTPEVKILSRGNLSKKFVVEGCLVSEKAKKEIEKAGGSVKE